MYYFNYGVVALNKLVDLAKKSKQLCFIFKMDFEKTYDYVSWSFLDYIFFRFSFNDKWRCWICAFVFSDNLVVLVNGCLT